MKRAIHLGLVVLLLCSGSVAQHLPGASQTLVILPFENASKAPGIEWIGESFPEVLGQRMSIPSLIMYSRSDRMAAFERLGVPLSLRPSRATAYRIAEEMDVDYLVMGRYTFDGQTFTASAQLLDMGKLRLHPEVQESGPLVKLIDIQTALAWDVMRLLNPMLVTSRNGFVKASQPIRLDALEAYVRAMIAGPGPERARQLLAAIRLKPDYYEAILELGKTYFEQREFEQAARWLAKIPKSDASAKEANFFLGLSDYYLGQYEAAEGAFAFVASRLPLTEVYNNLGVVASRRGQKDAVGYFERAVEADPADADYRYNLAAALYRAGDRAGAAKQAREALALRPYDSEAKAVLDLATNDAPPQSPGPRGGRTPAARVPLERIKRNYEEASFRQLSQEIENVAELRMAKQPPRVHATYHIERGRELLGRGFVGEAEHEFREAISLDQNNGAAHAGLATVLEATGDVAGARNEARASVRIQPSAEAYLVLARLDLRDNNPAAALQAIGRALALEPDNASAAALQRTVQAKLAEKGQR
ncbi:MAG TPA: tetratricopeptide repeat protein [Terriglobales bacterium]|nr:tetratricopeptide repeat protein [Terriglobales bacterium]